MQKTLSQEQVEAFYHDDFVEHQTDHFLSLVGSELGAGKVVVDVGGGCGFFARRLARVTGRRVKVLDMDSTSVENCLRDGIEAVRSDALNPQITGDEGIVCFNLLLHHLIGASEKTTVELQRKALVIWRPHAQAVFVNEYIYESFLANLSGWLIYQVTKSRVLSRIGQLVSVVVPSLRANTFGVGVRFRAHHEWVRLFTSAGYEVRSTAQGQEESISPAQRLLLIRSIRRDSFLLIPRPAR